jgi:hypothetical protein
MSTPSTTRRPGVVTFIGVILLIQAFLAAVEGIVLLAFKDDVRDFLANYGESISDSTTTGTAIGALIVAALLALVGFGILGGSRAFRVIAVAVVSLRMAFALYAMIAHPHGAFFTTGLVTLLVGFFVIWALYGHKESDEYFEAR